MRQAKAIVLFLSFFAFTANAQYNHGGNGPLQYKVFFDTSDFNLNEHYEKVLDEVVKIIKKKPGILFEVSGHTDTLGSDAFNADLSLKRAKVVKDYLVSKGVSEKNLYLVGMGDSKPFKQNGRYSTKFSRRVEFRQILRVSGRLTDAASGRSIKGKVLLNVPNKPMKNQEFETGNDGKFEFITSYRTKYYFFGFADGYLSAIDSIMATMQEPGSSNVEINVRMTKATITERKNYGDIHFFEGTFKIMPKSESSIQEIVDLMTENPTIYIEIRGHVDQPDRATLPKEQIEAGEQLSFARAQAINNALVKKGVSPARIKYRGMGSQEMLYPSPQTAEEREANRRVEIVILNVR
jgi:outer membrane protein OmpA-like peptidoglycan-associated protein